MLRAELVAAQEQLADMERQHQVTVDMIRRAARDEVERILTEAELEISWQPDDADSPERVSDVD